MNAAISATQHLMHLNPRNTIVLNYGSAGSAIYSVLSMLTKMEAYGIAKVCRILGFDFTAYIEQFLLILNNTWLKQPH